MFKKFSNLIKIYQLVMPVVFLTLLTSKIFASSIDMDDPTLGGLGVVLIRIMNWLIYLVGIVFVVVVAYGAWKASTSLGDPRGLESAKGTWTYALFGLLIVVGFFAIFAIVSRWFGFSIGLADIPSQFIHAIQDFVGISVINPPASGNPPPASGPIQQIQ